MEPEGTSVRSTTKPADVNSRRTSSSVISFVPLPTISSARWGVPTAPLNTASQSAMVPWPMRASQAPPNAGTHCLTVCMALLIAGPPPRARTPQGSRPARTTFP